MLRLRVLAPVALVVVAFDAFTILEFGLLCGLGENLRGPFAGLCRSSNGTLALQLPAWGTLVVVAGALAAVYERKYRSFAASIAVAFLCGAALWVLYGDPDGNFRGILTTTTETVNLPLATTATHI